MDSALNINAFGSLGVLSVLYKFYPYYKDNLDKKNNDLLTWVLCVSLAGFLLVLSFGLIFEPFVIRKFGKGSPLFLQYYYWIFPFGLGLLLFTTVEAFSTVLKKTIVPSFLRETMFRLIITVFILLYYFHLITFHTFIILFSSSYLIIFLLLVVYLIMQGDFHLTFTISRVTKKFFKKMVLMQAMLFSGVLIATLKVTIDGFLIASLINLSALSVYTLAQYAGTLVQVPQRSLLSISIGPLAQAWKDKDYKEINRIYSRSSINLLIMSLFIYGNILLNTEATIKTIGIGPEYLAGINVMIIIGLSWVIDSGTGVNNMVIGTSNFWRFEFFSGIIMLCIIIPINYYFTKYLGLVGPAYAALVSTIISNIIRWEFLRRKFNMQPFTIKTLYALLLAATAIAIAYFAGIALTGWIAIFTRVIIFSVLMIGGVFLLQLTPDATQLWDKWKHKIPLAK